MKPAKETPEKLFNLPECNKNWKNIISIVLTNFITFRK